MFPISPLEIVLVTFIVAIGACIQGSIGFGWAMLAAPFLVLIEPDFAPGPVILAGMVLVISMTYRERKGIESRGVKWMSLGSVPGVVGASIVLAVISATVFKIVFAILVLLGVTLSVIGLSAVTSNRNLFIAGLLSGFMGTMTSIGGPPVALIYQHTTGLNMRGTLSAFFLICASLALIGLLIAGELGTNELKLAVVLIPGLIIGFVVSHFISGVIDRYPIRPSVLVLSTIGAVTVLIWALV